MPYFPPGAVGVQTLAAADPTVTVAGTAADPTVKVAKTLDSTYLTDFAPAARAAGPLKFAVGNLTGDFDTASAVFVDIAAAFSFDVPAAAGDVLQLRITCSIVAVAVLSHPALCWNVAGVDKAPNANTDVGVNPIPITCELLYRVQAGDIVNGLVTVKPRWKTTAEVHIDNSAGNGPVVSARNLGVHA